MDIVFVYAPSVYWKMGAHQNVTPDYSFVNKIPWVSYEPQNGISAHHKPCQISQV